MKKSLIIGYGNLDRQDDGVAWHILNRFASQYDYSICDCPEEDPVSISNDIDILFLLQLMPELSEQISQYERVCFVDAHTGNVPEDLHIKNIEARFQNSPMTHHLTPESLMYFVNDIYKARPEAILVSVRGYLFEFERSLSAPTDKLADEAVKVIQEWGNSPR